MFDCAFKPVNGERSIHYMGHVRMMAAVQPFISGAISKTVNMPEAATPEEIEKVYLEGWKLGLKAIAIYRDGSKRSQPLSTGKKNSDEGADAGVVAELRAQLATAQAEAKKPHRRRLPAERTAVTHKFDVAGHEGYITVGLYPDGQPGEIFLKMAKEGSTVSGLMDTFATSVSLALQYGVPLRDLVNKFAHVRFEPSGFTGNQEIPIAKSIVDYVFRWLGSRFLPADETGADRPGRPRGGRGCAGANLVRRRFRRGILPLADRPESRGRSVRQWTRPSDPPTDRPTATAVAADPAPAVSTPAPKAELPVVTNGHAESHANGHANGNGKANGNGNGNALSAIAASLGTTKVAFTVQEDSRAAPNAARSWSATAAATSASTAARTSGCS